MQNILSWLTKVLILFDGEGAGTAGAASSGETAPAAVEQTGEDMGDAGSEQAPEPTPEERSKTFQQMIKGEYKDLYDAEVQRIVKNRLKGVDELRQQNAEQKEIIDMLGSKYGLTDPNEIKNALSGDTAMWEAEADKAGMPVDQYMNLQQLKWQNDRLLQEEYARQQQMQRQQQVQTWLNEAMEMKQKYPDFDLETELQNPQFEELMTFPGRNYSMEHVYKMVHVDDLVTNAAQQATAQTEKAVTENIKARGSRPVENGSHQGHGAFSMTRDFKNMSLAQIKEVASQIKSGKKLETIG